MIRGNLRLLLQSEGYRCWKQRWHQAEKFLSDPNLALVLLDLRMPGRDGMEVLRDHAELWEELPVIVVTALGGSAAAIEAMKLGVFDYITKPFDLDEVIFTVRVLLPKEPLWHRFEHSRPRSSGKAIQQTKNWWADRCHAASFQIHRAGGGNLRDGSHFGRKRHR